MTLSVTFNAELGFVESKLTGMVLPDELMQETIQSVAMGLAHDCTRFLSDFSEAEIGFSVLEVFDLPELQGASGLDRRAQIALVPPPTEYGIEMADFYETVCINRAWNARVFSSRQPAIDWLLGH